MKAYHRDDKHSSHSISRHHRQSQDHSHRLSSSQVRSQGNSISQTYSRHPISQTHLRNSIHLTHSPLKQSQSNPRNASNESPWVSFPSIPTPTINPISAAVQFVSTTLRPLTEPSIAYSSDTLANQIKNNLSSSCRSARQSLHLSVTPLTSSVNGLKRSRTVASSSSTPLNRKRSKSDVDVRSYRSTQTFPMTRPTSSVSSSKDLRSSAYQSRRNSLGGSSRQFYGSQLSTPVSSLRHKQLTSCGSTRQTSPNASMRSRYPSKEVDYTGSLYSTASANSFYSHSSTKSRLQSPLCVTTSQVNQNSCNIPMLYPTYFGGVGVYLNRYENEANDSFFDEEIQNENQTPRGNSNSGYEAHKERAKGVGKWCNRVLLSPLSSASHSVYSFFTNGNNNSTSGSADASLDVDEGESSEFDFEYEEPQPGVGIPKHEMSRKMPFRAWDLN